jgi:phosphoglycolate phosphatase
VLFDIDGTLIRDDGAAREAYAEALAEVYGYPGHVQKYDFSGKTDPEITLMVLSDSGYERPEIEAGFSRLWGAYLRGLEARVTSERIHVLDGVRELVAALSEEETVTLALLTGNIEPGARIKLEPTGLNESFAFGAFGSDSEHRVELPPIVIQRARELHRLEYEPRDVVIIGDSIYDIRCGMPHDATTIGVASGRTPLEQLAAEQPDHLFDDLTDLDEVLTAICGRP